MGPTIIEKKSWQGMMARCYNPNTTRFEGWGGRGIKVCNRWMKFENFLEDMGRKPSSKHSLDRIDNDGNYEPDNCRWATPTQQSRNQRLKKSNKTGYNGLTWESDRKKWRVRITDNYRRVTVGRFNNLTEAISAREQAERAYWG